MGRLSLLLLVGVLVTGWWLVKSRDYPVELRWGVSVALTIMGFLAGYYLT